MKDLSTRAKIFILGTILVGIGVIGYCLAHIVWDHPGMLLVLSLLASVSLILKVEGSTNRSHYNISFLVYAFTFVLLGPEATVFVILFSNLAEWAWHRYPWYIQGFNIAMYMIAVAVTGLSYRWINSHLYPLVFANLVSILAAMAIFTLLNHLFVGTVIWLARGENFSKSGIFDFFPLALDFILLCMGAGAAVIWKVNPFAVILVLLPLYLIYTTLKVPALERQTETDPKTGLFNARYYERALDNELARATRFDRPLTVVMADLDLLRNINNTYGHLAGDEVLIGIAQILKTSVRDYDIVARFGGEEFSILMPETTPEEAIERIEAIRKSIEAADFVVTTSVTPIKATMSFGLAGREGFNQASHDIVHNADTALYHAKLNGRNGSTIYTSEEFLNLNRKAEMPVPLQEAQIEGSHRQDQENLRTVQSQSTAKADGISKVMDSKIQRETAKLQPKWIVNFYIGGMAIFATLLFIFCFEPTATIDWVGLAVFAGMVILTEWLSIDIYARATAVSTSAAPIIAATLIFGPVGALLQSVVFATVALVKHHSHFSRFVFNLSNQLIAAMLYLSILKLAGVSYMDLSHGIQFLFCLAASGIVYLSTTLFISIGQSLDSGRSFQEIWVKQYSWLVPYYIGMGLVIYAFTYSFQFAGPIGTLIVLVPLLFLRLSQMQYIQRTKAYARELKEKNTILEQISEEIQQLNEGLLDTLADVVDLRDPYVLGHSKKVAYYAVEIAKSLGLPAKQVELIHKAGLLHDIGKLGISETILFKPDKLTSIEYNIVKEHAGLGADLVEKTHSLKQLVPIIRHHHERYDGEGYPDGLKEHAIPLEARILGVADAAEAMASDRPYRSSLSQTEIIQELRSKSGSQFDPFVVNTFIDILQQNNDMIASDLPDKTRQAVSESSPDSSPPEARYSELSPENL